MNSPAHRASRDADLAINGGSWQFNADMFLTIEAVDGKQSITGKTKLPHTELLCIFVGGTQHGNYATMKGP